ncbi:hypothetical protein EDB80DRAFT_379599 [Ilyonectria destructans]|nr:hypothetical protein EDB80DRAFT_379599 [Ilyonectria destructans]
MPDSTFPGLSYPKKPTNGRNASPTERRLLTPNARQGTTNVCPDRASIVSLTLRPLAAAPSSKISTLCGLVLALPVWGMMLRGLLPAQRPLRNAASSAIGAALIGPFPRTSAAVDRSRTGTKYDEGSLSPLRPPAMLIPRAGWDDCVVAAHPRARGADVRQGVYKSSWRVSVGSWILGYPLILTLLCAIQFPLQIRIGASQLH